MVLGVNKTYVELGSSTIEIIDLPEFEPVLVRSKVVAGVATKTDLLMNLICL